MGANVVAVGADDIALLDLSPQLGARVVPHLLADVEQLLGTWTVVELQRGGVLPVATVGTPHLQLVLVDLAHLLICRRSCVLDVQASVALRVVLLPTFNNVGGTLGLELGQGQHQATSVALLL